MASPDTVLVTGASSGIGRELVHCFARNGHTCVLLARSEDALHSLADTLRSRYGVEASVLSADLSVSDAAHTVRDRLAERDLQVDVLVNNAGFGVRGRFAEEDARQQMDVVQVNVTALTHLTRLLLPGMLERRHGGVLNVASTAAFQPGPNMSVYYATKAYVLSFSEGLAEEVAGRGVTVTCLAPGPTRTPFVDKAEMGDTALFRFAEPMTAEAVAQAGHDGFRAGDPLVIPGWPNKVGAFLVRFAPRSLTRKVAGWLNT